MTRPKWARCATCAFYDSGSCRRRAPETSAAAAQAGTLIPSPDKLPVFLAVWPRVRGDDWCGEWFDLDRTPPLPVTTS